MESLLNNLWATIIAGFVLTVVECANPRDPPTRRRNHHGIRSHDWWVQFMRWGHIISGVMWIGHLWYQLHPNPTMPKIGRVAAGGGLTHPARALFWFRWG